jgi:hypothetical protein
LFPNLRRIIVKSPILWRLSGIREHCIEIAISCKDENDVEYDEEYYRQDDLARGIPHSWVCEVKVYDPCVVEEEDY